MFWPHTVNRIYFHNYYQILLDYSSLPDVADLPLVLCFANKEGSINHCSEGPNQTTPLPLASLISCVTLGKLHTFSVPSVTTSVKWEQ